MPVQLQYVQLITDKTNAALLSSGVFAILISVILMKTKFIAIPHSLSTTALANSDVTKEAPNCNASL